VNLPAPAPAIPNTPDAATARPADALLVVCLCAAWCRTCDAYAATFAAAMARLQVDQPQLQARWIDVEDEADLLGDVDVETFPTLLVLQGEQVRFAGPLTPQPETLTRVLRAALDPGPAAAQRPEIEALARRLRAAPP
jgi:hypothetical protein